MFPTKFVEKIKTLFRKSCRSWENVERYFRAEHATYHNMAHERYMLDT